MNQTPSARWLALALVAMLVLAGCCVRSISDSGYDGGSPRRGAAAPSNPFYRGELSEFDVLGIDRGKTVTEQEIQQAIDSRVPVSLKRGASVMLIQSGALIPDDPMVKALEKYYTVGVFTGVPPSVQTASTDAAGNAAETYARSLRLSAARGGYEKVVVYWGLLETAQENLVTRTVSWVPVVGWALPDQRQRMRIRLKMAVIDVRSGHWEMFSPEAFDDASYSARIGRAGADQAQVWALKDKAYVAAADDLVKRYGR